MFVVELYCGQGLLVNCTVVRVVVVIYSGQGFLMICTVVSVCW